MLLTVIAALAVTTAFAADRTTSIKNYDVKEFTGIEVSHHTKIKLVKSEKCGLTIEVDQECIDFIRLTYLEDGTLKIAYDKLPFKYKNTKRSHMKVTAYMPNLNSISISGASELTAQGDFSTSTAMKTFNFQCENASSVDSLKISAPRANIHISGAAKANLEGDFGELIADISGASKSSIAGTAEELDLEVSGASGFNGENLDAKNVKVDLSGASKAGVKCLKSLEVKASGASACTYIAPNPIALEVKGITGASSFKKKN